MTRTPPRGRDPTVPLTRFRAMAAALVCFAASPIFAQSPDRLFQPLGPVGAFRLSDRAGRTITPADLKGKYWLAHFFYCQCDQGCARTTANVAKLHKAFADRDDLLLVSIHVAPQDEDADLLDQYAKSQGADQKWLFLRGDPESLGRTLAGAFKVGWDRSPSEPLGRRVTHSFFVFLVDPQGQIVGYVDGRDASEMDRLERRIRDLLPRTFHEQARAILPSLNAALNALCLVLLLMGYVAIRRRHEKLHIACMLCALAVSLVFLTSYVYYHFAILNGRPTTYAGDGWLRPVYYSVLVSHIVLAAMIAPLALGTAYLGLRDRRAAHRRLARWTLPMWLYVSVTGVLVYWMLYRL